MSTSLKRRRTSPDTYVAVNGSESNGQATTSTPTPKRASYLSPTKASLARSNPQLLENTAGAKINRESEPNRRQSLRDAVLGNRNLLPSADEQPVREASENAASTENIPTDTVHSDIDKNTSARTAEIESAVPNTPRHRDSERFSRQNRRSTPRRTGRSKRFASPKIVPQLVESPRRNARRSASAEMDLPPTPVQLGKDKLPDRPRGLSSSSPGGRDKHRATLRGGNTQTSPLKPRVMAPIISEDENDVADDIEIASGLGEDEVDGALPSNDGVPPVSANATDLDYEAGMVASDLRSAIDEAATTPEPDLMEKNQEIKDLQAQLQILQDETRKLQTFSARLIKNRNVGLESLREDFQLVLQNLDQQGPTSILPTDQNPLFQKHASSYLNLFTDPALTMSYETWEKTIAGRQKFVYQTTFTASKPWSPYLFNVTLETWTDWDTGVVEDVVPTNKTNQPELSKWFQSRRQDKILGYDTATLLNGTSNFFQATVKRAMIWRELIQPQFNASGSNHKLDEATYKYPVTSQQEATALLPYLFKNQHGFASPIATQKQTRRSLGSAKQLILTYDISLDWLGRPEIRTDILMTGFNDESVNAAQEFYKQVEQVGGIVKALSGVKNILGLSGNANTNGTEHTGAMRTKKGKARRVTIFD